MKIAWFTPFSQRSTIGKYSQIVTQALSQKHDITLWLFEKEDIHQPHCSVRSFSSDEPEEKIQKELRSYDLIVYNMGNYLYNHRHIYTVLQHTPGIIIFHDMILHHFFLSLYLDHLKEPQSYIDHMGHLYGNDAADIAHQSIHHTRTPIWEQDELIKYPLAESLYTHAQGILVHSQFHKKLIEIKYPGPVAMMPLCIWDDTELSTPLKIKDATSANTEKLRVVTIGSVNRNRKIEDALQALASHQYLKDNIEYTIIGRQPDTAYANMLKKKIKEFDLTDSVSLKGYVSADERERLMAQADVFLTLRFPAYEGASSSVLEELMYDTPVIVTNTGFFSEIPDSIVHKVEPDTSAEQISVLLHQMIDQKRTGNLRRTTGHQYVTEHHNSKEYIKRFSDICARAQGFASFQQTTERIMRPYASLTQGVEEKGVNKISTEIAKMYGNMVQ
jgi:glycosyltransferase involved in cell wall biosynthesis